MNDEYFSAHAMLEDARFMQRIQAVKMVDALIDSGVKPTQEAIAEYRNLRLAATRAAHRFDAVIHAKTTKTEVTK